MGSWIQGQTPDPSHWVKKGYSTQVFLSIKPPVAKSTIAPKSELMEAKATIDLLSRLVDGWDGDGSVGIAAQTIADAKGVVQDIFIAAGNRGMKLHAPMISGCVDGSIDFYWKSRRAKVLLNVPVQGPAEFSIKTSTGLKVSGALGVNTSDLIDYLDA